MMEKTKRGSPTKSNPKIFDGTERIVVRLDSRIASEAAVLLAYRKTPRARRQEMIRKALSIGLKKAIGYQNGEKNEA
jgi:hypothetical protein